MAGVQDQGTESDEFGTKRNGANAVLDYIFHHAQRCYPR